MRKIRTRLNILGVLIIILSGLVVVGVILNMYMLQITYRQQTYATDLYVALLEQNNYLRDYQADPSADTKKQLIDANQRIGTAIDGLKREFFVTSEERTSIQNLQVQYSAISLNFDILFSMSDKLSLSGTERQHIYDQIRDYTVSLRPDVLAYRDLIEEQRAEVFGISMGLFGLIFFILILIGILIFRTERRFKYKFNELERAARRLAEGRPTIQIAEEHGQRDELKDIAQSLNVAATRFEGDQRMLKELRDLDARKNEFISSASHELKTPLASLRIMAELLNANARTIKDTEAVELTSDIKDEIDYMTRLINDMLDVTRMVSNKLTIYCKSFDMTDLIQKEIERFYSVFPEHQIVFNPGMVKNTVFADKERVKQVIGNLLSNAAKYSRPGTSIIVNVRKTNRYVRVSVQDFGSGISVDDQKKIFKQFFRTARKSAGTAEGFGLGLYIAKQIVELHGGKVWVRSRPKYGSTFYFTIPSKRTKELSPEPQELSEESVEKKTAKFSFA